jgi:hypothetical protein
MKDRQRKAMFARITALESRLNSFRTIPAPHLKRNRLPVQISVLVPSTKQKSKPLTQKEFDRRVIAEKKYFSKTFGGDSSTSGEGSYFIDDKGKKRFIREPNVAVEASTTAANYRRKLRQLEKHFSNRRKEWGQDSLLIKVEGQAFIAPKKSYIPDDKTQKNSILVS